MTENGKKGTQKPEDKLAHLRGFLRKLGRRALTGAEISELPGGRYRVQLEFDDRFMIRFDTPACEGFERMPAAPPKHLPKQVD